MNTTYNIEMRRDKFSHVTGRHSSVITHQVDSIFPDQVDITEQFPMLETSSLNSSNSSNQSHTLTNGQLPQLLRRSIAKFNLVDSSIISTAEKHFRQGMSKIVPGIKSMKPKLTSSMMSSCHRDNGSKQMITFHVESASTPTKRIARSSTPKSLLRIKKNVLTSTIIEKRSLRRSDLQDLSVIKERGISRKRSKMSGCGSSDVVKLKLKKTRISEFISSTGISNEVNLDQHQIVANVRPTKISSSGSVQRKLQKKEWKQLKYPIRYYPNMKVKDIDRNFEDMYEASEFEGNLRPIVNDCYSYGNYNVWIV